MHPLNRLINLLFLFISRDRWDYYQEYINSTFELIKNDDHTEGADYSVDLCHEFLTNLIETSKKKVRGPYMGKLELHRLMVKYGYAPEELFGDFLEMLAEYFR